MANYTSLPPDGVFRALADPTRRAVLERLGRDGPTTVRELAAPFDMALPSFLQHIKALEAGGLVRSRKIGRSRRCELDGKGFAIAETWLAAQRRLWAARLDGMEAVAMRLQAEEAGDDDVHDP